MRNHYVHRCLNNLGVSVIGDGYSVYEVAVIHFGVSGDWVLVYDTPITDDVVPCASIAEVNEVIRQVESLPHRPYALEG